jgi:hypothetical protein
VTRHLCAKVKSQLTCHEDVRTQTLWFCGLQ